MAINYKSKESYLYKLYFIRFTYKKYSFCFEYSKSISIFATENNDINIFQINTRLKYETVYNATTRFTDYYSIEND